MSLEESEGYPLRGDEHFIEGYASPTSVRAGEHVRLHISTSAPEYSVEVARVGLEREIVWAREGLTGARHPVPELASTHGCGWPASVTVAVPREWRSGYYGVTLRAEDGGHAVATGEISFVMRAADPGRDGRILLQLTTNTDQAYNTWGGTSLYRGPSGSGRRVSFERPYSGFAGHDGNFLFDIGSSSQDALDEGRVSAEFRAGFQEGVARAGHRQMVLSQSGAVTVQRTSERWQIMDIFGAGPACYNVRRRGDRLAVYNGSTGFEDCWRNWELPFVRWAEDAGYRMDYAVNADLEAHPEMLDRYRLVLSVGHDEYWSTPMRDSLESFIGGGGNVAFLSGNCMVWQVRFEDGGRAMVSWKDAYTEDPHYESGDHSLLSTMWCNRLVGRPENRLTGVSFAYGGYARFFDQFVDGDGAYTMHRPEHWLFEGTGLERGDLLGAKDRIVSYEADGCEMALKDGLPAPTHRDGTPEGFEILATGLAGLTDIDGSMDMVGEALYGPDSDRRPQQPGAAVLGVYQRGGTVVTTGCTNWTDGLRGRDPAVERITRNILDRLSA